MKNYSHPGETLTVTAPAAVVSGAGVLVGAIFGVAQFSAASGDPVEIKRRGVFSLPKTGAQAWTQGDALFWDTAEAEVTSVGTGNVHVGFAPEDVGASAEAGAVLLTGAAQSVAAYVADASSGSAGEVNALRDALVDAGLMASS
ncbi:DUF2190 family protein [Marinibacterium sp. SX1]|uniref:DUF2190 family protein n=1 Tax=Marinibacterium sp. SX1 TaxID=3388424 RepID=UPI003D165954